MSRLFWILIAASAFVNAAKSIFEIGTVGNVTLYSIYALIIFIIVSNVLLREGRRYPRNVVVFSMISFLLVTVYYISHISYYSTIILFQFLLISVLIIAPHAMGRAIANSAMTGIAHVLFWSTSSMFGLMLANVLFFNDLFVVFNNNNNVLALYISLSLFPLILWSAHYLWRGSAAIIIFIFVVSIAASMITGARSVQVALIMGLIVYLGANIILNNKFIFIVVSAAIFLIFPVLIFSIIYIDVYSIVPAEISDMYVQQVGKRIDSGRGDLWRSGIEVLRGSGILGVGLRHHTEFFDTDLSLHNWYLTIVFQYGMIGVVIFWAIIGIPLTQIWSYNRRQPEGRLSFCMLVILMTVQSFEVTLSQNMIALSLPAFASVIFLASTRETTA